MTVQCKCGWSNSDSKSIKEAEVIADVHESTRRNPRMHDANIVGDFWSAYETRKIEARIKASLLGTLAGVR
jgi:hypothetical protein